MMIIIIIIISEKEYIRIKSQSSLLGLRLQLGSVLIELR